MHSFYRIISLSIGICWMATIFAAKAQTIPCEKLRQHVSFDIKDDHLRCTKVRNQAVKNNIYYTGKDVHKAHLIQLCSLKFYNQAGQFVGCYYYWNELGSSSAINDNLKVV